MVKVEYICILAGLLSLLLAFFLILYYRAKSKRISDKIEQMIDKAMRDEFVEEHFDETRLSRLESKFFRYISGCEVNSREILRDKQKINTLISDISHQTKTPIANILLYTQLLGEQKVSEDSAVCIRELARQSKKLNFLIESLIKASRLENGIIVVKPEMNSIQELLEEVQNEAAAKANDKNIKIKTGGSLRQARFDFKWTVEAVYNVVDNAIKYSPPGSVVSIFATELEMFSRIEIIDQGIGIDEAEHEKIFQRFYRSSDVNTEEGAGIGLYLTREIVSSQGGYIMVKSKKGEGSSFYIFLPR